MVGDHFSRTATRIVCPARQMRPESHRDPEGELLLKYPPVYKLHPRGNETAVALFFSLSLFLRGNKGSLERITAV